MDMGRNSEHYSDPTPGTAWENMRREEKRLDAARLVVVSALVPILRQTAELAGFEIIGRIPLRDKATGRSTDKWKALIFSAWRQKRAASLKPGSCRAGFFSAGS